VAKEARDPSPSDGKSMPDMDSVQEILSLVGRVERNLSELFNGAEANDPKSLATLGKMLKDHPHYANRFTSLQAIAERSIFGHIHAGQGGQLVLEAQVELLRRDLAGDEPTPTEQMMVNRVVLDWLHMHACDQMCQKYGNAAGVPLTQADFYHKQAERAHKRFLRSVTALVQIRKLLGPTVQVNVAHQQVNVAGPTHVTTAKDPSESENDTSLTVAEGPDPMTIEGDDE
jgi:hypothetical protein